MFYEGLDPSTISILMFMSMFKIDRMHPRANLHSVLGVELRHDIFWPLAVWWLLYHIYLDMESTWASEFNTT